MGRAIAGSRPKQSDRPLVAQVQHTDSTKMSKYYLCEAQSTDVGVSKVTPYETPQEALTAASNSTAKVHFISTVNPLAKNEENKE